MRLKKLFLVGLVCAFLAPSSAFGDTPQFNFKKDNVYFAMNAGATILNDLDFDLAGQTVHGATGTGTGSASFDAGASIGGALGYVISDFVRAELELSYQEMDYDKFDLSGGNITSGGTTVTYAAGEYDVSGDINAFTVLANVIFTPLGNKTFGGLSLTPLIGGGIGLVDWKSKIDSVGTQTINGTEDDTDFLASVMAGLEYTHSQQFTFSIKYRHVWADSGKNGVEDAEADNIAGTVTYRF